MSTQRAGIFTIVFLLLAACSTERTELARVISPDQKSIAVLIREDGGGAAGSSSSYVYLVETQGAQKIDRPTFVASRCDGLSAQWKNDTTLQVTYLSTCSIKQFVNFWYRQSSIGNTQSVTPPVEIVLVRKEVDP